MATEIDYHRIWQEIEDFQFKTDRARLNMCRFARQFDSWAETLFSSDEEITSAQVQQAKLLLLDRYFEWRSYVPKSHRNRVGERGHVCIFQVFVQTYDGLKKLELSLSPKNPYFPDGPMLGGLFLGELKEE